MFSFKGFFTKEKNTHLEHLEDDIINRGSKGGQNAINFLKSVRNMLAGSSGKKVNMTVKWDGHKYNLWYQSKRIFCRY